MRKCHKYGIKCPIGRYRPNLIAQFLLYFRHISHLRRSNHWPGRRAMPTMSSPCTWSTTSVTCTGGWTYLSLVSVCIQTCLPSAGTAGSREPIYLWSVSKVVTTVMSMCLANCLLRRLDIVGHIPGVWTEGDNSWYSVSCYTIPYCHREWLWMACSQLVQYSLIYKTEQSLIYTD